MAYIRRNFTSRDELGDIGRYKVYAIWARNVIQRWIKEMEVQEVSPHNPQYTGTGDLARSFYYKVFNASGGDQSKILFVLNNYGKFVDMGVGSGQKYSFSRTDKVFRAGQQYQKAPDWGESRVVKPFLMPVFKQRLYSLAQIMKRKWADEAKLMVVSTLTAEDFGLNPNK